IRTLRKHWFLLPIPFPLCPSAPVPIPAMAPNPVSTLPPHTTLTKLSTIHSHSYTT
ncbi:hypothetical protein L208DRAFT_1395646, partial [Tricholoma matsutake]